MLNYFGETLLEPCGNCDICTNPPETFDATIAAQKALSCVHHLRQSFGIAHVVAVLRGAKTDKIRQHYHTQLSTYGIGKEFSEHEWMSIIRQLIHRGILFQDLANYSVLKLTESARPLLRGEETLHLAKPRIQMTSKKSKKEKAQRIHESSRDYDANLFEFLRELRQKIATRIGMPPYIVFSDASLRDMAAFKPQDKEALLAINGVGEIKLERYGAEFLSVIQQYEGAVKSGD